MDTVQDRRSVVLLCLISFLQGLVFYAPVATLYRTAVGVTAGQIALIESVCYLLMLVLEMPWGLVTARIGYKNTLLVCCALFFVSKLVFWRAGSFGAFLAERVLLAVVLAGLSGCDSAYLYICAGQREAQRVFGLYSACGTAGVLLAGLVFSVWLGGAYRLAALLTVLSYGAAALAALGLAPVPRSACDTAGLRGQVRGLVRDLRRQPAFLLFLLAAAALSEVCQLCTVFLSQLVYQRCGMADSAMGAGYIAATLAAFCGAWSHRATGALGGRRFGLLLFLTAAVACGVLAGARSGVLCVVCIAALRAVDSLFEPYAQTCKNRNVSHGARAVVLSGYSMVDSVAASAVNLGLGQAADASVPGTLWLCAGLCALAGAGFWIWARSQRAETKKE